MAAPALNAVQGTIARTHTTPTTLFTLPSGAVLVALLVSGGDGADAADAALRIGRSDSPGQYVGRHSVSGAGGRGLAVPAAQGLGDVGPGVTVVGSYSGGGSTGGPWTVTALYI